MDVISIVSIGVFLAVLVLLVFIRDKSGNRYEVRNPDIMLALILPAIILFVSGKIESFQFGDFKIESAFVAAAQTQIKTQVTKLETGLPVQAVTSRRKVGVIEIPNLIRLKTEVLTFVLGQGNYYGPAIETYLKKLTVTPYFKYILIVEKDGTFWGLSDARKMQSLYESGVTGVSPRLFAKWINNNNHEKLKTLPGLLTKSDAVSQSMDKSEVLTIMEAKQVDQLPALDEEDKFSGIVNRSRIVSSMILDVTSALQKK